MILDLFKSAADRFEMIKEASEENLSKEAFLAGLAMKGLGAVAKGGAKVVGTAGRSVAKGGVAGTAGKAMTALTVADTASSALGAAKQTGGNMATAKSLYNMKAQGPKGPTF